MSKTFSVSGNYVDVRSEEVYPACVVIVDGKISEIIKTEEEYASYLMPGFIDAHVHIESSMLLPTEFARLAVVHGTVGTISDPHEIGNVLGVAGVKFMIENGKKVPFKFYFGAPSCVPATEFETAGARIDADGIEELLSMDEVVYLAEVMNFPGVLNRDKSVMDKIAIAKKYGKVIDGHAPGLQGDVAKQYIDAGISTDHECFTAKEAEDKLKHGMKILIREGSAAKNFEALIPLFSEHAKHMMFCSDDKHPNDLIRGHINQLAQRAVAFGCDAMKVIQSTSMNVVDHYSMKVGLLQQGDPADFIVVNNLEQFKVLETYIDGEKVAENGTSFISHIDEQIVNQFNSWQVAEEDIRVVKKGDELKVIVVEDGQLITKRLDMKVPVNDSNFVSSDTATDMLKLVVVDRYTERKPAVAFIRNFGLESGAIASTVAHDSHNIIAVGVEDTDILKAINALMGSQGGVSLSNGKELHQLDLPVAGLMSNRDGYEVAEEYEAIDHRAKELGSSLASPFMTLSFCALLVIPELKLSDKGLFDGRSFSFVDLFN